jgi:hypothetical protein
MAERNASDVYSDLIGILRPVVKWERGRVERRDRNRGRGPSLIVVPIDYSLHVALSEELGVETVGT